MVTHSEVPETAKILHMKEAHILEALELWKNQFTKYCSCDAFPDFIKGGLQTAASYIKKQIYLGNAIAAVKNDVVVGYMAWSYIDFHGERTAFLPVVGHSALLASETEIYDEMYAFASRKWVNDNRFNHLWMVYYDDDVMENHLYNIGFGSYVLDACQSTCVTWYGVNTDYRIMFASEKDADALLEFANLSNEYYADSPIFLKRSEYTKNEIEELIDKDYALIAWDKEKMIGVMSFTLRQGFHIEHLTTPDSAYIKSIGAYICPDYRGKGVGTALLEKAFAFCNGCGILFIHVCFETANPNAMRFWPKYFKPAIRSVRRTINKDANT